MLDNRNGLNLTPDDIEIIEAALHTQKRILMVQNEAGARDARQKLWHLKQVIKRVAHSRASGQRPAQATWAEMARGFFAN
ncbi:MAG: hypothetical protein V2I76_12305 [Roseobacter sp.]|nr:hypothetical protein [Roseobacter sp.]